MHSQFRRFCERLWKDWLRGELQVSANVESRFQTDHLPEPYLRFGTARKPLCILTTNPGAGMPHQHRKKILSGTSVVDPSKTYLAAAIKMARFYTAELSGQAGTRLRGLMHLAQCGGHDGFLQYESCPFHSKSLPNKRKFPQLMETDPLLRDYVSLLREALRDVSVVTLSAVSSKGTISPSSISTSPWLSWQANLMDLALDRAKVLPLSKKQSRVTLALIYSRSRGNVKAILLMMGGNHLPAAEHRVAAAKVLRRRPQA
jgi:hypothetical protein